MKEQKYIDPRFLGKEEMKIWRENVLRSVQGMDVRTPHGIQSVVMNYEDNTLFMSPSIVFQPFREKMAWYLGFVKYLEKSGRREDADFHLYGLVCKLKYNFKKNEIKVDKELINEFLQKKQREIGAKLIESMEKDLAGHNIQIPNIKSFPVVKIKLEPWQRLEVKFGGDSNGT